MEKELIEKFKENPNLMQEYLTQKLEENIEQITMDVIKECKGFENMDNRLYEKFKADCLKMIKELENIDMSKLKQDFDDLKQLENLYADEEVAAWRPKTGTISAEPLAALSLIKQKMQLIALASKQNEVINDLSAEVQEKRQIVADQAELIESIINKL